ncbi:MAG: aminotransferase class V-fold PLP-dependent enzyme [Clostridia bacterium]|nr:aminotransferase class V-fold PLP-dependent enzyme [Clostridia bacterium]
MTNLIYLDNGATTKPLNSAIEYASVYNTEKFFNASALYSQGLDVHKDLLNAKKTLINAFSSNFDVIFTSCGTESDNTAIFSYLKRGNAVTTMGEHSAVYNAFTTVKNNGYDARFATLNSDGSVDVKSLLSLIDKNTVFVSVVHVNNETGAVNDVNKIARLVKEINPRIVFHSDGVQAFMKIPFKPNEYIDLYSVSAHKINGLKGVGALFKNKKLTTLKPYLIGGGQESGYRSGTENSFGIKVFEFATKFHHENLNLHYNNACELKNAFLKGINSEYFTVISSETSSPYIVCLSANGLRGEVLQHMLEKEGVIIGTGSACSSKNRHSRMLESIGYSDLVLDGVIRISFSFETTLSDVEILVKLLNEKVSKLKLTMKV